MVLAYECEKRTNFFNIFENSSNMTELSQAGSHTKARSHEGELRQKAVLIPSHAEIAPACGRECSPLRAVMAWNKDDLISQQTRGCSLDSCLILFPSLGSLGDRSPTRPQSDFLADERKWVDTIQWTKPKGKVGRDLRARRRDLE